MTAQHAFPAQLITGNRVHRTSCFLLVTFCFLVEQSSSLHQRTVHLESQMTPHRQTEVVEPSPTPARMRGRDGGEAIEFMQNGDAFRTPGRLKRTTGLRASGAALSQMISKLDSKFGGVDGKSGRQGDGQDVLVGKDVTPSVGQRVKLSAITLTDRPYVLDRGDGTIKSIQKGGKSCMVKFDSVPGEYLYNTGLLGDYELALSSAPPLARETPRAAASASRSSTATPRSPPNLNAASPGPKMTPASAKRAQNTPKSGMRLADTPTNGGRDGKTASSARKAREEEEETEEYREEEEEEEE
eukprot:CAMPEP_0177721468 /NCGR_PEP_ID=MMETSP0484_2-20121128/17163_1 /TAXON_ID=354590 /ORGANISM="Rhodomonas lens, Strain RHODO" /LENGTH=298 /DNA_ID=CAMNT_0019233775 /DNA_START=206 /DNA_END=1099 /DNA_ORIENTATION=-